MSLTDELAKLQQLRDSGAIDDQEFATAKQRLLSDPAYQSTASSNIALTSEEIERHTRQWGLLLHLSQFAGYAVPIAGFIAPVVIWQLKKDEFPLIDEHGKNAMNWMISSLIYAVLGFILCFVVIGIPLLFVLTVCAILFPILAAIKANNGEVWKYPGAIKFF